MSTLLKKKYCKEQQTEPVNNRYQGDSAENESIARSNAKIVVPQLPSTSSPTSTAVSNDDDSVNDTNGEALPLPLIMNSRSTHKSLRFNDVNGIVVIDEPVLSDAAKEANYDYSELVDKYRNDIWYTRDEYRTFWNDRMTSIRLWKFLNEGKDQGSSAGSDFVFNDEEYTVRGLENYIDSSSQELNRQRDLYTLAALQDPYNTDRILATVSEWSTTALQRAQLYALRDAADVNDYAAQELAPANTTYRRSRVQHNTRPPISPASAVQNIYSTSPITKRCSPFSLIKEINKRLIEEHASGTAYQYEANKKQKRRSSSAAESAMSVPNTLGNKQLLQAQRRNSTSSSIPRRPVHLQIHQNTSRSRSDHIQVRRPSMSEDLNQHMMFCNRLINDLPKIVHPDHGYDSLSLRSSRRNTDLDRPGSVTNQEISGCIDKRYDYFTVPRQLRRDSMFGCDQAARQYSNRRPQHQQMDYVPDITKSSLSCGISNISNSGEETKVACNRRLMRQLLLEQQQKSLAISDTIMNDYVNYIGNYSRLRRDSLAGNLGHINDI